MSIFPIKVRVPKRLADDLFQYRLRGSPTDAPHWRAWRAAYDAGTGKVGPLIEIASPDVLSDLASDCDLYLGAFDPDPQDRAAAHTLLRRLREAQK